MAGLEKIKEKIISDAENQAAEILRKAGEKASAETKKTLEEANAAAVEVIRQAEARAADITRSAGSAGVQAGRNALLSLRRSIVEKAFDEALAALRSLAPKEYFELISKLIISGAMPGEGRLVLSELDEKRMPSGFLRAVNQELPEGYKLRQDGQTHIDPVGGFLLVYEGIEINCTFASLLQSRREQLEDTVVGILFS